MSITICPYFEIQEGKVQEFKDAWAAIAPAIEENEPGCAFYQFTFNGNVAFCREGYDTVDSVMAHLARVDATLKKVLEVSKFLRFEVHGPAVDLAKLKEPLSALSIDYFEVEPSFGFRR